MCWFDLVGAIGFLKQLIWTSSSSYLEIISKSPRMETYFTVFNKGKTYLLILKLFLGVYIRMSYIFLNIFSYVLCNMLFFFVMQ